MTLFGFLSPIFVLVCVCVCYWGSGSVGLLRELKAMEYGDEEDGQGGRVYKETGLEWGTTNAKKKHHRCFGPKTK